MIHYCFFFNDTATTEIYTLSLHDALPISAVLLAAGALGAHAAWAEARALGPTLALLAALLVLGDGCERAGLFERSEEHTSELQSRQYLVCRLLLEKKKKNSIYPYLTRLTK